jgi:hypothetical protein
MAHSEALGKAKVRLGRLKPRLEHLDFALALILREVSPATPEQKNLVGEPGHLIFGFDNLLVLPGLVGERRRRSCCRDAQGQGQACRHSDHSRKQA